MIRTCHGWEKKRIAIVHAVCNIVHQGGKSTIFPDIPLLITFLIIIACVFQQCKPFTEQFITIVIINFKIKIGAFSEIFVWAFLQSRKRIILDNPFYHDADYIKQY